MSAANAMPVEDNASLPSDLPERGPERTCIATGVTGSKTDMVRFVLGPDGTVVPDVEGNLPGRGLWVMANRAALETAIAKKRFAFAARTQAKVPEGLVDTVASLLRRRCLSLLGLARRGGLLVAGFDKCEIALHKGGNALLVEAADGAADGRKKMRALAPGLPVVSLFSGDELADALGRDSLVIHAVMKTSPLAARILTECTRLAGFLPSGAQDEHGKK